MNEINPVNFALHIRRVEILILISATQKVAYYLKCFTRKAANKKGNQKLSTFNKINTDLYQN